MKRPITEFYDFIITIGFIVGIFGFIIVSYALTRGSHSSVVWDTIFGIVPK